MSTCGSAVKLLVLDRGSCRILEGDFHSKSTALIVLAAELRSSLEEHQSALELIMTKYREQVFRLLMASKRDDPTIVSQLKEQHTTVSNINGLTSA